MAPEEMLKDVLDVFSRPEELAAVIRALPEHRKGELVRELMLCLERKDYEGILKLVLALKPRAPKLTPQKALQDALVFSGLVNSVEVERGARLVESELLARGFVVLDKERFDLESWGGDRVLEMAREVVSDSRRQPRMSAAELVFARAVVRLATGKDWEP